MKAERVELVRGQFLLPVPKIPKDYNKRIQGPFEDKLHSNLPGSTGPGVLTRA